MKVDTTQASQATDTATSISPPIKAEFKLSRAWFSQHGWQPFPFQKQVWQAVAEGISGMLHATTGAGKTYAVWLAALERFGANVTTAANAAKASTTLENSGQAEIPDKLTAIPVEKNARKTTVNKAKAKPLTVLWITPMRALAADTERALTAPINELELDWSIGLRTGDTGGAERARQAKRLPTALITTPESLSLLLTRPDAQETFATLQMVVVDEWHELIGNKRGVQMQLALARLRN
jgi:ATP-dependent Lhr-like helicase